MNDKTRCNIFQKLFLACFPLFLVGCATQEPVVRTVLVEVPVLVPCKTQEVTVPSWAATGLKRSDSLEVKVRALLAERRQRMGYERELVAAATACH
ncbi:lipoprotein [Pseudomonas taetrolens]|nr:lipoprotein [Pseudomonas taetrolens]